MLTVLQLLLLHLLRLLLKQASHRWRRRLHVQRPALLLLTAGGYPGCEACL